MSLVLIGETYTINQEETMEKVKNEAKRIWGLAVAHPKISAAVVIVVVAIYFLAN